MMPDCGKNSPTDLPQKFAGWFDSKGWRPREHQLACLDADREGLSHLLIAPTGGGKTLAGFLPSLIELDEAVPASDSPLHTLYISPLKALAVDIARNLQTPIDEMGLDITIETRTGDTRQRSGNGKNIALRTF